MTTEPPTRGISIQMLSSGFLCAVIGCAGRFAGTNAGTEVGVLSVCRDSLIQRRTRLAYRPLSRAMSEMEAPV